MRRLLLAVLLLTSFGLAPAQEATPDLDGYVTSVASATDFAVDGVHVVCVAKTRFRAGNGLSSTAIPWTNGPYVGQPLKARISNRNKYIRKP
jgi:hypothetical protein